MKFPRAFPMLLIGAFVLPALPIYRGSAEAFPMESLETDEESTSSYNNPSWNLSQLIDEIDAQRREEALENLQKMFGIRSQIDNKSTTRHKTPPQFMMELYKTIADPSGVTRGRNPYNAKIVRSFIERDSWLSHLYLFNISGLEINESVLEAELHLYRKRMSFKLMHPRILSSPYYLIKVYQVVEGKSLNEPDLHKLLNVHYVGAHASGWQVFNVKQAVLAWVSGVPNLGLIVTASTLFGDEVSIEFSRRNEYHHSKQPILVLFDDDDDDDDDDAAEEAKVRGGVVSGAHYYTYENEPDDSDLKLSRSNVDRDEDEEEAEEDVDFPEDAPDKLRRLKRHESSNNLDRGKSAINEEQSYGETLLGNNMAAGSMEYFQRKKRIINKGSFGNEKYNKKVVTSSSSSSFSNLLGSRRRESEEKAIYEFPSTKFVSEEGTRVPRILASMDIYERAIFRQQSTRRKSWNDANRATGNYYRRETRETHFAEETKNESETSTSHGNTRENTTECGRHELYVDFKEIGLSSSIIAPKGYSAYHCQGPCNSPLSQDQQPTNHATVQGIVHKMGLVSDVHMPCCVPTKLLSTTILFFDDNENVVLKVYEDMIADRCGCR